jgi:hypothetical protein
LDQQRAAPNLKKVVLFEAAIREGIPFVIKMADGERYEVPDRDRVALGKTTVIVVGDDDMPRVLPLLTMTGVSYLKKD